MNTDIFIKKTNDNLKDSSSDSNSSINEYISDSIKYIDTYKNNTDLLNTEDKKKRYINKLNYNMNNLKSCQDIISILIELLNNKEDEVDNYKIRYEAAVELLKIKKRENEKLRKKLKKYS